MVGDADSPGAVPCAIWWLFRALGEHKHRTGARCSVRVSAIELPPHALQPTDLLKELATGSECSGGPGAFLRDEQPSQSELRAPSAERAAFLLDAAMAARTHESEEDGRHAHFLFTLHVYQYRVEKGGRGGVAGGRSRLHLLDLGSGDKSLSTLGNVVLALCSGQKHVPYRDSGVTQLLRRAVGGVTCRVTMLAHVPTSPARHPEALATLQLASRLHRLRRKKLSKFESGGPVGDDKGVCRPFSRLHAISDEAAAATTDYTSSSEQSCDTVIFVGPPPPTANDKSALTERKRSKKDSSDPLKKGRPPEGTPTKLMRRSESSIDNNKGSPKLRHVDSMGSPKLGVKTDNSNIKGSPKVGRHVDESKGSPKVVKVSEGVKGSPKAGVKHEGSPKAVVRHSEEAKGSPMKVGGLKPLSDEAWIDGPRFAKPRFDARALQRERWVDGPALYMDDRKETMVRRWVEELRTEVWIDFPKKAPIEKKEGGCQTEDVIPTAPPEEVPSSSSSSGSGGEGAEARMTDSSVQVTEEDIDSSLGGGSTEEEDEESSASLHALSADALHRLLDLEEALSDAHSIRSAPVDPLDCPLPVSALQPLKLEAFYNRIQKVPLFPLCSGKPTQAVPPTPKLSSSGRGSDLSLLSTETKALLAKTAQFSGTSSGYESLPRPQQDPKARGRKGTRKKAQGERGCSKRSRSVPARPPAAGSPPQLPPRPRRLLLPPVDPSLWKSEEDVCCTSLLCCRLLDFY